LTYGLSIIGLIVTISILFIVIFCNTRSTKSRMISYKVVYKRTLDGILGVRTSGAFRPENRTSVMSATE
jgi:hypothetical protein